MLVSKSEYARIRGVSPQAVGRAVKTGRISAIGGKIDPAVANIQWDGNRRRAPNVPKDCDRPTAPAVPLESDPPGLDVPSLEMSRRRREHHEANLAEMRERQKAGELVELAQVHLAYTTLAAQLRAALERIPDKVAPRLANAPVDEIHELLSSEIEQALLDMARTAAALPDRLATGAKAAVQ